MCGEDKINCLITIFAQGLFYYITTQLKRTPFANTTVPLLKLRHRLVRWDKLLWRNKVVAVFSRSHSMHNPRVQEGILDVTRNTLRFVYKV